MNEPKTILLAEDNPKDIELTIEAFAETNLAGIINIVNNGIEAMEYLRCEGKFKSREGGNPAVVLMDIKMPHMDGIEVLQAIRNDPAFELVPVVMFTSSQEKPDLTRSYKLGANAYVVKPLDFKEFLETIRQIGIFWVHVNIPPIK
jgi:CheY-like chemotaxis protein